MPTTFRTDRHNNPCAITVDIAAQGKLVLGDDYLQGDPFSVGTKTYYTAKLLGDPISLTIKVIDNIGFYTKTGSQRWTYIGIPDFAWKGLTYEQKKKIIGWMYSVHEGGTDMRNLFV